MDRRTSTLTDREKEVLRHVHALKTSAQISHDLHIAEVSVNKRIDSARRKLGGISRRQAALLLAQEEQQEGYDNLIPAGIILTLPPEELHQEWIENSETGEGKSTPKPPVAAGGRRNRLDVWQRLGVILLCMAVLAAVASVYIALLRWR